MNARVHACTRRSLTHDRNQDRAVVGDDVLSATDGVEHTELQGPAIVAVLDGLGGHPAGDVASELSGRLLTRAELPLDEAGASELLQQADTALQDAMRDDPDRFGMGTTAALVLLEENGHATVANVGDSSVFKLADGQRLARLTVSDRARGSAVRQCLGADGEQPVTPHTGRVRVAPGEHLLLATDGLTDVVAPADIETALRDDVTQAAACLCARVEAAGRPDDVTIIVVEALDPAG